MSNQHTPGPWHAIAKPDAEAHEGTHWIQCGQGALGYWRGHKAEHTDSNWVLNEADALLIAAAPEMLAAIDEFLTAYQDEPSYTRQVKCGLALESLRMARAKATSV